MPGIGLWGETRERWIKEGLPLDTDVNLFLGLAGDDCVSLPLDLNMNPGYPVKILDENNDYVDLVDEFGVTKRLLRSDYDRSGGYKTASGEMSSMSQWLDFPVKDIKSWKKVYEIQFASNLEKRLHLNWNEYKQEYKKLASTRWSIFSRYPHFGLFGPMREFMGVEGLLYAMSDDPGFIDVMVNDLVDFWLNVFDRILCDVRLDQIIFFEDMCATKAPLIGPAMFRRFLSPGYARAIGSLRDMGVKQFFIDTDGNALPIISEMIDCGITGILPCEVQSGMDPEMLRRTFPSLCLTGGIDKRALTGNLSDIDAELEKRYSTAWTKNRYMPSLDHGAPPDIPLANIIRYAKKCIELCELFNK